MSKIVSKENLKYYTEQLKKLILTKENADTIIGQKIYSQTYPKLSEHDTKIQELTEKIGDSNSVQISGSIALKMGKDENGYFVECEEQSTG